MPRYLVKFEDGTEKAMGFPGPDSDKIKRTATETAEKQTGKKVISLQLAPSNKKTSKAVKGNAKAKVIKGKTKATANKKVGKTLGTLSKKKSSLLKGNNQIKSNKKSKVNSGDPSSIKGQITDLENTLSNVIQDLTFQISELKASILMAKKQELLNQLDEIDSQL